MSSRFTVGHPARKESFYGRKQFVESIRSYPWTWVCGQRRIGKTSVLRRYEEIVEEKGGVPLFLDLAFVKEIEASGAALFRATLKGNAQERLRPMGISEELFSGLQPAESFRELAHRVRKKRGPATFIWDEAERLINVERNDPGFLDELRGYLQSADDVAFVIGASQLLSDLYGMGDSASSFLGAFRWQPIGPLSREAAEDLLQATQTGGWDPGLDSQLVTTAARWAGGHPRILQELGATIEEERLKGAGSGPDLDMYSQRLLANVSLRGIIEDDFAKLTSLEQLVLREACRASDGVSIPTVSQASERPEAEVRRAINQLSYYGYVSFNGEIHLNYRFYRDMLPDVASVTDSTKTERMSEVPPPSLAEKQPLREAAVAPLTEKTEAMHQVLSDARIKDLLETDPHLEGRVTQAAHYLCETEQVKSPAECIDALLDFSGALRDNKVNIFVSYKIAEARTADTVIRKLQAYSAGKLNFLYSGDYDTGKPWRTKLRSDLEKAHWFLLLLPDPSEDWDWCLWETGYFQGTMHPGHRLICIHHPKVPRPDQIAEFQTVVATPDGDTGMISFLKEVFLEPNAIPGMGPINEHMAPEIEGLATQICDAIVPPFVESIPLVPYLKLSLRSPLNAKREDLGDAAIVETSEGVGEIFGLIRTPDTFGQLIKRIKQRDGASDWLGELASSIRAAAAREIFPPVAATFESVHGGKAYRPILHAIDVDALGSIRAFQIVFIEDVGTTGAEHAPNDLRVLATSLRLAYRFRYEVLEPYSGRQLNSREFRSLGEKLEAIETEATRRGMMDPELLAAQFSPAIRAKIVDQYAQWAKMRNPDGSGHLDRALESADNEALQAVMAELSEMNRWFLGQAAQRFAERVASAPSGS